jgi:hypothetical protein
MLRASTVAERLAVLKMTARTVITVAQTSTTPISQIACTTKVARSQISLNLMFKSTKFVYALLAVGASAVAGWLAFKPQPQRSSDEIYGRMANRIDVDPVLWRKVGKVLDKATSKIHQDLSNADIELLYQALDTGKPGAQVPALMALSRCPPKDLHTCYSKIEHLATHSTDPEIQSSSFSTLWYLFPNQHAKIRLLASNSQFPDVVQEVKEYPEQFPKKFR